MRGREKGVRKEREKFPDSFPELIFSKVPVTLFSVDFAFAI